ncbi:hypothetical protein C8Q77DRAFT_153714 [Trametes polyzona]|nr:hypothetical protein C8Q77DRAFT_153714 [Trametes polyzona]
MVAFSVIVAAAVGKSLVTINAVKTRRVAPLASKVKSSFSKLASGHKAGVTAGHNLLRRRTRKDMHRRRPCESLPRVLAPLPEDIHGSLAAEVEEELLKLQADNDKASDDTHTSTDSHSSDSDSTLAVCDEFGALPIITYDNIVEAGGLMECVPVDFQDMLDGEAQKDLVYTREAFSVSEVALFEIKLVAQTALPMEDYYAPAIGPEGLVPQAGYDLSFGTQ